MDSLTTAPPIINEDAWQAWVLKGKLAEKATNQKLKIVAGMVLVLLIVVGGIYTVSGK
jgi:hypothetical protein